MATSRTPDSITTTNNINNDDNGNSDYSGFQHNDEEWQNDVSDVGFFFWLFT